ncbi:arylamine N-acetyltransferase family protein [Brevibacillus migulae]|uniref:arylamine N-acetyltransferase family protein n=1 Tax=Brevibacillus migulae TaxID=1644114 RepID=UPI00106DEDF1|nr:arylamine N-acetyltransferase [Brevibacillus migulae]
MSDLNALFRKRIGLSENKRITFEDLDHILEKTAKSIPFENFRVIEKNANVITRENLVDKILIHSEGGLCYELNPLFYLFLRENGFQVVLARGIVYNHEQQRYPASGRTHITILLTHEDQTYVVDTGFGGNVPLKPVPLTGEMVASANGEFRIKQTPTEYGDYIFEMKLKHKDTDWKIGYAFDSRQPMTDVSACDVVRQIIVEHPESPFNKSPLITKRTDTGSVTLTETSFTQWENGQMTKEPIDGARFTELLRTHFGR